MLVFVVVFNLQLWMLKMLLTSLKNSVLWQQEQDMNTWKIWQQTLSPTPHWRLVPKEKVHCKWTGLSLRARGQGSPPATMNVVPGYFLREIEETKPKEVPDSPPTCCIYPATWNLSDIPEWNTYIMDLVLWSLQGAPSRGVGPPTA